MIEFYPPEVHCEEAGRLHHLCNDAAMTFLDPPYNIGMDYGAGTEADLRPEAVYCLMMRRAIMSACHATRPGGVVACLISEQWADFTGHYMTNAVGKRVARIIWHERFAQYTESKFVGEHRHLFIHRVPGGSPVWNTDGIRVPSVRMKMGDKRAKGPRVPGDVWTVRRLQGTSNDRVPGHPCQLAPEPLTRLVEAFTNPGDIVAEQFVGVGSLTRVAARLGRRYIGVENNPEYCEIAHARGVTAAFAARQKQTEEATI